MKRNLFTITAIFACLTFSGVNTYASPFQIAKAEHKHQHSFGLKSTKEIVTDGVKFKFFIYNIDKINQALKAGKKNHFYSCSMHPFITSENSGNCGICGMKLDKTDKTKLPLSTKDGNINIQVVLADSKTNEMISNAKIKMKLIAPDKKEQEKMMDNEMLSFGSYFFIRQKGKYGVIALVRSGEKDRVTKFYYENN